MVRVAQLVRAPDCGSGGRGFESRLSPFFEVSFVSSSLISTGITNYGKEGNNDEKHV